MKKQTLRVKIKYLEEMLEDQEGINKNLIEDLNKCRIQQHNKEQMVISLQRDQELKIEMMAEMEDNYQADIVKLINKIHSLRDSITQWYKSDKQQEEKIKMITEENEALFVQLLDCMEHGV